jgi:hypothetical protein
MTMLLVTYLASSIVVMGLSVPLLLGKIGPNGWYGFRTSATLNDPQLWYAVNHYAAKRLLFAGVVMLIASLVLYILPGITVDGYALACLAVFMLTFLPGLGQSFLYLRHLSRSK